jgi:hypothetical protein
LVLALALAAVACEPAVTPSPSPSPSSSTATPSSSPRPAAREEIPRAILSLPYAPPAVDRLGASTTRVGGITGRGPSSLAVDEQDQIYIWDQARLRVAVYQGGKYLRSIPMPYVEREAGALLVESGRLYLRATAQVGVIEYEIDVASGALVRAVTLGNDSLYPRRRASATPGLLAYSFGADAAGMEYVYASSFPGPIYRYERVDPGRGAVAYAIEPLSLKGVDAYVRADGALYELAADFGGVGNVYVYALLAPSASAQPASARPPSPVPAAFGRSVPDRLTAMLPSGGSVELDAPSRRAVWWLASLAKERTDLGAAPQNPVFAASWGDGSRLEIVASAGLLFAGGKIYLGAASTYEQLAAYALASPPRLSELARAGASIRLADLADSERSLTSAEIAQLRDSLSRGFAVAEAELPGELELPFPVYELVFGEAIVQLRGDDYGSLGRLGAFAHDGKLDDLARRWLPVPQLSIEDVRSLFQAQKVMFEQGTERQDISRWKATIVRGLTAPNVEHQSDPTNEQPATFSFQFANGRTERVEVRAGAYTYRGRVYARPGVLYLVYLRGVP